MTLSRRTAVPDPRVAPSQGTLSQGTLRRDTPGATAGAGA